MAQQADTRSAPLFRDVQLVKTLLTQPRVIFGRVRRIAVMVCRPDSKVGCQLLAVLLQPLLLLSELKIHEAVLPTARRRSAARQGVDLCAARR
jgi:hypothetical protein